MQQWFSPWPAVCEESTWQPKCVSVAVTDESETPKFRPSSRRSVSWRLSSVWQLFTRSDSEAKVAQWYVYWEALDNRKGGGCCWNVTTIDIKLTQKSKWTGKLWSWSRAPRTIWEKNSQQCTGQDGNHSFYKARFYMEKWPLHRWGVGGGSS